MGVVGEELLRTPTCPPGLMMERVICEPFVLAMPDHHLLFERRAVELVDLSGDPLFMHSPLCVLALVKAVSQLPDLDPERLQIVGRGITSLRNSERRVLALLYLRRTHAEIGYALGISRHTASAHTATINLVRGVTYFSQAVAVRACTGLGCGQGSGGFATHADGGTCRRLQIDLPGMTQHGVARHSPVATTRVAPSGLHRQVRTGELSDDGARNSTSAASSGCKGRPQEFVNASKGEAGS